MAFDDSEELEVLGKWWVPGRNQSDHPGVLSVVKNEYPCLNLLDNLSFLTKPKNGIYTDRSFNEFFPMVCGRTAVGPATLINFRNNQADFLILDAVFQSEEEARFRQIRLQFQHLLEWLGQTVVNRSFTLWKDEEGKPIGNEVTYVYRSLSEEVFCVNGLELKIFYGLSTRGGILTPVTLTSKAYIDIIANVPKSVAEWWRDVIHPLRDLLSLAVDRPIDVHRFSIFDERDEKPKECRVYFKKRKTENYDDKELTAMDMLFSRTDIDRGFLGTLLENWFNILKDIPVFSNLYSSVISVGERYLEEEFLTLAQAAELYHRSRFNNNVLPKDKWKEKIELVIGSVPEDERMWLREKLIWSNAPTLQNRLEELLEFLEPVTSLLYQPANLFYHSGSVE